MDILQAHTGAIGCIVLSIETNGNWDCENSEDVRLAANTGSTANIQLCAPVATTICCSHI